MINAQRLKEIILLIDEYVDDPKKVEPNQVYRALRDCVEHISFVDDSLQREQKRISKELDEIRVYGRKTLQ